ncbi:MAG TPA: histone H1 protein [Gammaproteobacteria bacterium]|jgi:hypothetical protein|nr:histone H1 protein [Gammaproteobacteria bacterium]
MSKKLESKLADSVRQAKQQNETPAAASAAQPAAPQTETKPAAKPAQPGGKFASQNDQAPKPSLDSPWANLYPARIWPD